MAIERELDRNGYVSLFREMIRIRIFEEKVHELYQAAQVVGKAGLGRGQEAVPVGISSVLAPQDLITSTHRAAGHLLSKGLDMFSLMAELCGRRNGCSKAKGGKLHISDLTKGILGSQGIVGSSIPIAVGAALAAKMRRTGQLVVCYFGDGAANQGTFHEALNMAGVWKLPVVFVCENNLYGFSVRVDRCTSVRDIAVRAVGYGFRGEVVNGNDVLAVRNAAYRAREEALSGIGPVLLEFKTYRWDGHMEGDPGTAYRTKEEVEEWKGNCPIKRYKTYLLEQGYCTEEEMVSIENEIIEIVEDIAKRVMACPKPPAEWATTDLFTTGEIGWV